MFSGLVPENYQVVSLAASRNDFRFSIPVKVGDFQVLYGDQIRL